jgi:hypothetical protein
MTDKPTPPASEKRTDIAYPGMMGCGTDERNLDATGTPAARIKKDELDAAFGTQPPKRS